MFKAEIGVCGFVTAQVGPTCQAAHMVDGVARNGAGDYTITISTPNAYLDALQSLALVSPASGATFAAATVERPTDATLRVRTFDAAGVAVEANFYFALIQAPSGTA